MRAHDRFLTKLYEQTLGRVDRTVHAYRHIAIPLGLSLAEMQECVAALIDRGLVEVDPELDRLIRLTPMGVSVHEQRSAGVTAADLSDAIVYWRGFAVPSDMYVHLTESVVSA